MMNKMAVFFLSLLCILSCLSLNIYAFSDDVQIQMHTSDKLKNNQGFNIYFSFETNTSKNIGAFRLQVQYDSKHFSFMEAKFCSLDTDNHLLKAYAENDIVTLVFASREALEYSVSQDIFYMRFKAIDTQSSENYTFQTNIMEIVDFEGRYLSVSTPTAFYINGSDSGSLSSSDNVQTSSTKTQSNTVSNEDILSKAENISEESELSSVISSTEGETIILQDNRDSNIKENNFPTFLIFIILGVLIFCVAFYIGRSQRKSSSSEIEHTEDFMKKKK